MRKIFCVILFSLLFGVYSLYAQHIRAFEFEAGGLVLFPNGTHVQYSQKGPGWGIYLEPRINIGNTGFDIAAQFSYASIRRSNPKNDLYGLLLVRIAAPTTAWLSSRRCAKGFWRL